MALMKKKYSEIPADAVILGEEDALKYQLDIIRGWKKKNDTWIFNYGFTILASCSALSAIYINNHYRVKLRLLNFGRLSSYLPVVALPSIVSGIFHQQFIVTDVVLQKSCPTCVQLRAASFQSVLSTIFPTILAPLAALPFAIRYNTYTVPLITKEPRKVFEMLYKHTKPIGNILLGILAVQGLVAALITYKESQSLTTVHRKLNELEERLETEHQTTG
ncbi:uncharacterized protein CBL_05006 [Carabus blaptoides fortunei]